MELIKRILSIIHGKINGLISTTEDPELVLEQAFLVMQENLVQLRQGVAQAIATQKRTERQASAARSRMEEWYSRAELAVKQGNESLAREALTKRQADQETATALSNQIEAQNQIIVKLKQDMRQLELKIMEVKTKKDMYIARFRSAEASYRLQEMLSGVSATSSLNAFERMEDQILEIEAKSETISHLSGEALTQKFASLESSQNIDVELEGLKTQLNSLPKTPES